MSNPMGLLIPTPGTTPGPDYATEISTDLGTIASHTHTGASNQDGEQVPTAGININADLSFNSNNATSLRSNRFGQQSGPLVGIGDVGCVYDIAGDLWWNNGSGTPVQITSGSSLVITPIAGYTTVTTAINLTINAAATTVLVSVDATSNAVTVTLPLANSVSAGRFYIIKDTKGKSATNTITVQAAGADQIDGGTGNFQTILSTFGALCVVSDGTSNWLLFKYDYETTPITVTTGVITIPTPFRDVEYLIDVSGGNIVMNLPQISKVAAGIKIRFKDSGAASPVGNVVSIHPHGTDTIEGLNASKAILTAFGEIYLINMVSGWFMI